MALDKKKQLHFSIQIIQFQSVGFLHENCSSDLSESSSSYFPTIVKCQHCDRVHHFIDKCFDLYPCMHSGKHAHCSEQKKKKCFLLKKYARNKIHFGWITFWWWSLITKKLYQSYLRFHLWLMTYLVVEKFSSLHIVHGRGKMMIDSHKQVSENNQVKILC